MSATIEFIGQIRTPYKSLEDCPRNIDPGGPECELIIRENLKGVAAGLVPGQQILVLYWFENIDRNITQLVSRKTGERVGVFSLRSPVRPNPIAAAVVTIERIENQSVFVRGLDCLDKTPLLDIKPAMSGERA